MPDLWLAEMSEWYEFSKERTVPENGSLNPSNCSLRHLNTGDRDGAFSLKGQDKKNEQRLQNKRTKRSQQHPRGGCRYHKWSWDCWRLAQDDCSDLWSWIGWSLQLGERLLEGWERKYLVDKISLFSTATECMKRLRQVEGFS